MMPVLILAAAVDVMTVLNSPFAVAGLTMLLGGLLALHLLRRLGDKLDEHADKVSASNPKEAKAEHAAAWLARKADDFLSANGQDVKALANPATRAAAEAHLVEQAKAQAKAALDSMIAKASVLLLCVAACLVMSCAHVDPVVDTGIGLDTAAPLAAATSHAMDRAVEQHMITPQAYAEWGRFLKGFIASYDLLVAEWKAAKSAENEPAAQKAHDALAALLAQLMRYGDLVMLGAPADGGAP